MVKKIMAPGADVSDVEVKTPPAGPSLEADVADVLRGLDQHSAATDGAARQQEAKLEKQEVDTVKADILDLLNLVAGPARPLASWLTDEQFEQLWGQSKREQIAAPLAAIARRHGWDMSGALNDYGPYAMLAGALGPSVYVTFKVRQQAKAFYAEQANASKAPDASTSS